MRVAELIFDQVIYSDTYQAHLVESKIRQWIEQKKPVRVRLEVLCEEDDVSTSIVSSPRKRFFTPL
jgi:hypothetical protein